jgi:hypothetical protein
MQAAQDAVAEVHAPRCMVQALGSSNGNRHHLQRRTMADGRYHGGSKGELPKLQRESPLYKITWRLDA